jgi:hypothetical protein
MGPEARGAAMNTSLSTEVAVKDIDRLTRNWWTTWSALHWGFRSHACCLWACHGQITAREAQTILGANVTYPLDLIIFYRELVKELTPEHELARMIVDATPKPERTHLSRFYGGNAVFAQGHGSMRAIHNLIDEVTVPAGIPKLRQTDDGPNSRIATARMVFDGLRQSLVIRGENPPVNPVEATVNPRSTPLLLISEECPNLISTIPGLGFDPKNPEDVITFGNMKDSVWAAVGNAYRDYPSVVAGKPVEVLRAEAINRSYDPTQRHINLLKFNEDFEGNQIRPRKR